MERYIRCQVISAGTTLVCESLSCQAQPSLSTAAQRKPEARGKRERKYPAQRKKATPRGAGVLSRVTTFIPSIIFPIVWPRPACNKMQQVMCTKTKLVTKTRRYMVQKTARTRGSPRGSSVKNLPASRRNRKTHDRVISKISMLKAAALVPKFTGVIKGGG